MSTLNGITPAWLLALENAELSLPRDMYIDWLLLTAAGVGVPDTVIQAQLSRAGHKVPVDAPVVIKRNVGRRKKV